MLILVLGLSTSFLPIRAMAAAQLQPIRSLNLPRYMGTWYEVAKYPNRFQQNCIRDTMATYRLLPQGTVEVRNQCTRADGTLDQVIGEARRSGSEPDSPKLEVRFAPAWLSFIPWVWGDYWVLDLDPDYQLAAISEPSQTYLWILSRTPQVDAGSYQALLHRLAAQGIDIQRLERSAQTAH